MTEEKDLVALTAEEQSIIQQYQLQLEKGKGTLGSLRQQYLSAERRLLDDLAKSESDYFSHLKVLANSKGIDVEKDEFVFDPQGMTFRRK